MTTRVVVLFRPLNCSRWANAPLRRLSKSGGGERTHRAAALCVRARVPAGAEARDAARRPVKPIRGNERKRKKNFQVETAAGKGLYEQ